MNKVVYEKGIVEDDEEDDIDHKSNYYRRDNIQDYAYIHTHYNNSKDSLELVYIYDRVSLTNVYEYEISILYLSLPWRVILHKYKKIEKNSSGYTFLQLNSNLVVNDQFYHIKGIYENPIV